MFFIIETKPLARVCDKCSCAHHCKQECRECQICEKCDCEHCENKKEHKVDIYLT